MTRFVPALLAAGLAVSVAAQQPDKPLGDLLDILPQPEGERPPPRRVPVPPVVPPGSVGTTELPASDVADRYGEAEAETEPAAEPSEADAAWAAMQEQRRREINAVEAPRVAELNAEAAVRLEEEERRAAEAQADYRRRLAEQDEEVRRVEAEHRAALERHRREVARQRALYAACLAGDRTACPPR